METKKEKYRKPELNLEMRVGITKEVHKILRKQRIIQKKSMARIVNDLIIQAYANETVRKMSGEPLEARKDRTHCQVNVPIMRT